MLVGRELELERIAALLDEARGGTSGVLAIVGEAGVGKSALLAWAADAAGGMTLLRARGVESEAQVPFAGLFELLRPALANLERLPPPQAAALEGALALRPARAGDRFAVGAATLALLAAQAEGGPLAILVDDAHWLDGSTADALRFALRRLVADPIAAVVAVRDGEPSLLDGADLPRLELRGLDLAATAALLHGVDPGLLPDAAARLHRDTGGNPLALLELAPAMADAIPIETPVPVLASLAEAFGGRVRALPPRAQAALALAAASDSGDAHVLARAAARLGLALEDLGAAEDRGLVTVDADRVEFRHPLVRAAVYGAASPSDRRAAHRAIADALPDSQADRRAWHLALAAVAPDDGVASALEQTGARARARSAYDAAARAYERAARLTSDAPQRARLALAAADCAWLAGQPRRANELLDEAARHGPDEATSRAMARLRGHVALRTGSLEAGRRILSDAAERAAATAPAEAIAMLAEATEGAFFAGDAESARGFGERAAALLTATEDPGAAFFARMSEGMGRVLSGDGEAGAARIREAVALLSAEALAADDRLLAWAAMPRLWLRGADAAADDLAERAAAAARASVAAGALPHLLTHIGIDRAGSGRYLEARATFDEAARLAYDTGQGTIRAGALARLAAVEARTGRSAACREHAAEALVGAHASGAHLFALWALAALAEDALARDDHDAALGHLLELDAGLREHGMSDADLSPAPDLVELHLRMGHAAEAREAAAPFGVEAAAKGQPWVLARAARCRGLLAGDDGFAAHLDEALALHARTPDRFEEARTRLTYGALLRRAGRRRDAREELRAALATFDDLGAVPWAEQARRELAASGETARRRDPSTLDDLTPQELKVALLLAGGRTVREAAATLFLSPKTIEYHLRNAYRKLDVRSRDDLARALRGRDEPVETRAPRRA